MRLFFLSCLFTMLHIMAMGQARGLCPVITASLMNVPGNMDATTSAQRVEVRQCTLNASRKQGTIQLVAWARDSKTPGLTLDLEEAGFQQFAMIEGVYAFELIGGKASQVIVIAFDNDVPRVAARDSALDRVVITSDRQSMHVEVSDGRNKPNRHYDFRSGHGESRRY